MTFLLINSSPDCDADRTCGFAGYFCGVVIFIIFVVSPGVAKFPPTKFSIRKIFHSHCSAVWIQTSDICYGYFSLLAPLQCLWSTGPLSQAAPCVMIEESEQRSEAGRSTAKKKKRKSGQYFSFTAEEKVKLPLDHHHSKRISKWTLYQLWSKYTVVRQNLKLNSGGLIQHRMKISTHENNHLYGIYPYNTTSH